jgi:transposase
MEPSMTTKEALRLSILTQLAAGVLTQAQAAAQLDRSVRQVKRLLKAFRQDGDAAVLSKRRGKASNRKLPATTRAIIVERCLGPYRGFGPKFTIEKLEQRDDITVSKETVRKILIAEGLWKAKKRRRHLHPTRKRRSCFGELIQADGSPHFWFEERGPYCTLLLTIDDATSQIGNAFFLPTETTVGYFHLLHGHLSRHGRPEALYTDRHSIFRVSGETKATKNTTSFGQALETLGIELICANSPQAKGRVERANRTLQDRLIKEMRLQNISTIDEANAYLPTFISAHNDQFAYPAEESMDRHASIDGIDLEAVFVLRDERKLDRNLCLQFENGQYRLTDEYSKKCLRGGVRIIIEQRLDGSMHMRDSKRALQFELVEMRKGQGDIMDSKEIAAYRNIDRRSSGHKPAANHPWRGKFCQEVTHLPEAA